MIRSKSFFHQLLILLCCGIVFILFLAKADSPSNRGKQFSNNSHQQLFWDGTQLVYKKNEDQTQYQTKAGDVPLQLRSLLFQPIPINTADFQLLVTIPGIGPSIANKIIIHREKRGRFTDVSDLMQISGIGNNKARLYTKFFIFDK